MRKSLAGAALTVIVVGVGALSYWAGTRSSSSPPKGAGPTAQAPAKGGGPPPGVAVEAARVSVVKLPNSLAAVGSLRSDETIILRPEIAGRIAQILFKEG